MRDTFKAQNKFYAAHKDELVRKYLGKEVLIYRNEVRGAFDSVGEAYDFAIANKFTPNRFMIKKVVEQEPVYCFVPVIQDVSM